MKRFLCVWATNLPVPLYYAGFVLDNAHLKHIPAFFPQIAASDVPPSALIKTQWIVVLFPTLWMKTPETRSDTPVCSDFKLQLFCWKTLWRRQLQHPLFHLTSNCWAEEITDSIMETSSTAAKGLRVA